jgi:hypothetical protein
VHAKEKFSIFSQVLVFIGTFVGTIVILKSLTKAIGKISFIAILLISVSSANLLASDSEDLHQDFSEACGPIASHVALRTMGVETNFKDSIDALEWSQGNRVSLSSIERYLNSCDLDVGAVRTSPTQLKEFLLKGNGVAILPVRLESPEVNHVVCIVGLSGEDGFIAVGYPDASYRLDERYLRGIWDGEVLLVAHPKNSIVKIVSRPMFIGCGLALAVFTFIGRRKKEGE